MSQSRPARLARQWACLPQTNRLHVVHTLGQILIRRLLDADGREGGRENT
jgi:hypothetical protein